MCLFAMPAPPSAQECATIALIFGLLASAVAWMAFRRLRLRGDPTATAKWIMIGALFGSMAAAFAGPIALPANAMPHWIGYNTQDTLIRSFIGSLVGIAVVSLVIRLIGMRVDAKSRTKDSISRVMVIVLVTAGVGLLFAVFASSAEVGTFVLLQLSVIEIAFAVYVYPMLSSPSRNKEKLVDSASPTESSPDPDIGTAHLKYESVEEWMAGEGIPQGFVHEPDPVLRDGYIRQYGELRRHLYDKHVLTLPADARLAIEEGRHPSQSHRFAEEALPYCGLLRDHLESLGFRVTDVHLAWGQCDLIKLSVEIPETLDDVQRRSLPWLFQGFEVKYVLSGCDGGVE